MIYKIKKNQFLSRDCFICGTDNPIGLKAKFYETENKEVIVIFRCSTMLQGFPNILHGGISATVVDELIARVIMAYYGDYTLGLTTELKICYKKIIPLDVELKAIARMVTDCRLIFTGAAEIFLPDGTIAATAEGKYFKKTLDTLTDHNFLQNHWRAVPEVIPNEISL